MPSADSFAGLLSLLLMAHFIGDFALQSDRMATEKSPGADVTLHWSWWLTAHAGCHGFLVAWITGIPWLGVCEWAAHWLIDYLKCQNRFTFRQDQLLHLTCKLIWTAMVFNRL